MGIQGRIIKLDELLFPARVEAQINGVNFIIERCEDSARLVTHLAMQGYQEGRDTYTMYPIRF